MKSSVLMCEPKFFSIEYEINPWMNSANDVNHDIALNQWNNLVQTYNDLGVEVKLIEPNNKVPDLVFTANAGLIQETHFSPVILGLRNEDQKENYLSIGLKTYYNIVDLPKDLF